MVVTIRETTSTSANSQNIRTTENIGNQNKTVSFYSYNTDPDLLIREYFHSSSDTRVKSRKNIARNIDTLPSFLENLKWSVSNKARDAYDGGLDLLTEINDIKLLIEAFEYLQTASELWKNSNHDNQKLFWLDSLWEIFIKCIAYSDKIPPQARFLLLETLEMRMLSNRSINRRIFKASLIDAFMSFSDEVSTTSIRTKIERLASCSEKDQYIRNYAEEALQELQ